MSGPQFPPPNRNDFTIRDGAISRIQPPPNIRVDNRPQMKPAQQAPQAPAAPASEPVYSGSQFPSAQLPKEVTFPAVPKASPTPKTQPPESPNTQDLRPVNTQEPVNKQDIQPVKGPTHSRHKPDGPGFTTKDGQINFPGGVINKQQVPPSSTEEVALERLKASFRVPTVEIYQQ
jgi:hypothetical protein